MDKNFIRTMLEVSTSFEQADDILKKYTTYKTDEERIAFLEGMFDCVIIERTGEDVHTDYIVMLTSIIDKKWRRL